ncbi:hypothetical protein RB213_014563 [Colletotrichum asianum]
MPRFGNLQEDRLPAFVLRQSDPDRCRHRWVPVGIVANEAVRADHQDTNEPIGPSVVVLVTGAEY